MELIVIGQERTKKRTKKRDNRSGISLQLWKDSLYFNDKRSIKSKADHKILSKESICDFNRELWYNNQAGILSSTLKINYLLKNGDTFYVSYEIFHVAPNFDKLGKPMRMPPNGNLYSGIDKCTFYGSCVGEEVLRFVKNEDGEFEYISRK